MYKSKFSIEKSLEEGFTLVSQKIGYYILFAIILIALRKYSPMMLTIPNLFIIVPALTLGLILVTWKIHKGQEWSNFATGFDGFKYSMQLILSNLFIWLVNIILLLPIIIKLMPIIPDLYKEMEKYNPSNLKSIKEMSGMLESYLEPAKYTILITSVVLLVVNLLWTFIPHFIGIYNNSVSDAIKNSITVCKNNFWALLALLIILGIINILGMMIFDIGSIFTVPFSITTLYAAFAQATHCDEQNFVEPDTTNN